MLSRFLVAGRVRLVVVCAILLNAVSGTESQTSLRELKARLKATIHRSRSPRSSRAANRDTAADSSSGVYHHGDLLHCTDCHIMHASKDGETFGGGGTNPTGYAYLLRRETSVELCLMCHDGVSGVPDVVGADINNLTDRAGGMFTEPGVVNPNGHQLWVSEPSSLCLQCHFGGDFQTATVGCTDCHDPHGNGIARNLHWASDPDGTPPLGLFIDPSATGLDRYERDRIAYGTDGTANLRETTNMCLDCHHVYSGSDYTDPDGNGSFNKHPASETERGATVPISQGDADGGSNSAHWVAGTGAGFDIPRLRFLVNPGTTYAQCTVVDSDNNVFCLTCHKAHGSEYPDAVVWAPNADGSRGPSGCDQCHAKSE